jgi:hypothetical protein
MFFVWISTWIFQISYIQTKNLVNPNKKVVNPNKNINNLGNPNKDLLTFLELTKFKDFNQFLF